MRLLLAAMALFFCAQGPLVFASEDQEVRHRIPGSYIGSVKRLEVIHNELHGLVDKHQLYKIHEPLELFDAILQVLPQKAEAGIYDEMRRSVERFAGQLAAIAEGLDESADGGNVVAFKRDLHNLEKVVKRLSVYAELSNEKRVNLGHNIPRTYRKMITRLRGVKNSLADIAAKGYLYKAHEDAEHIKAVAANLEKVFETNVIETLKERLAVNRDILARFSKELHVASDEENTHIARNAFKAEVVSAIRVLKSLGSKLSSSSTNHYH